mmetsp:Transcript_12535/g.16793  ORF Transcript_12535/g.16793 Transcript_12535/m.16793 type:complete len:213 (-) Transcript_12535:1898-2536(-)
MRALDLLHKLLQLLNQILLSEQLQIPQQSLSLPHHLREFLKEKRQTQNSQLHLVSSVTPCFSMQSLLLFQPTLLILVGLLLFQASPEYLPNRLLDQFGFEVPPQLLLKVPKTWQLPLPLSLQPPSKLVDPLQQQSTSLCFGNLPHSLHPRIDPQYHRHPPFSEQDLFLSSYIRLGQRMKEPFQQNPRVPVNFVWLLFSFFPPTLVSNLTFGL